MTGDPPKGRLGRLWRHLRLDARDARRRLTTDALDRLEARVKAAEQGHGGEVRVCLEAAFPFSAVWHGVTPRERALAMFSHLRVWDTERNNGVLVYLLLADRAIEIVADRGIANHASPPDWAPVVADLQAALRADDFEGGLGRAIDAVGAMLRERFALDAAGQAADIDELPNRPHVI